MTRTRDVFSFYFSFFNKIFPFFRERRILPVKFEQQVILLAACVVTLAFEHLSYLISGQDHRAGRTILKTFHNVTGVRYRTCRPVLNLKIGKRFGNYCLWFSLRVEGSFRYRRFISGSIKFSCFFSFN